MVKSQLIHTARSAGLPHSARPWYDAGEINGTEPSPRLDCRTRRHGLAEVRVNVANDSGRERAGEG
jgi:hypothetical protein